MKICVNLIGVIENGEGGSERCKSGHGVGYSMVWNSGKVEGNERYGVECPHSYGLTVLTHSFHQTWVEKWAEISICTKEDIEVFCPTWLIIFLLILDFFLAAA